MIQTLNDIIHKYTVRATSAQYQEKKLEFGFHKKTTRNYEWIE